jgi:hypothetical protein
MENRSASHDESYLEKQKGQHHHDIWLEMGDIIGRDITALPCYMEYCSPDGIWYHANPNYNNEGSWYDWGLIHFEQLNRTESTDASLSMPNSSFM